MTIYIFISHVVLLCVSLCVTDASKNQTDLDLALSIQEKVIQQSAKLIKSLANKSVKTAFNASVIFAQEEAGSAVCIHPSGIILTCAHCIAEDEKEWKEKKKKYKCWLIFTDGSLVQAKCFIWDMKRDLALLRVIAVAEESTSTIFPYLSIAQSSPAVSTSLVYIGQPAAYDLETEEENKPTNYSAINVSKGKFLGYIEDADLQDNRDIGTLKHNCWTYWGHSGAPLIIQSTGELIGLHSSWDDQTGTRHGVPLEAIVAFLKESNVPFNENQTVEDNIQPTASQQSP